MLFRSDALDRRQLVRDQKHDDDDESEKDDQRFELVLSDLPADVVAELLHPAANGLLERAFLRLSFVSVMYGFSLSSHNVIL